MLKLDVRRGPLSDHSYFAEREIPATLSVVKGSDDDERWLRLRFVTNPDGKARSEFRSAIYPMHFVDVAQMMMEANPEAAIRAFGRAMENAQVQRRTDQSGSDEAA